MDRLVVSTTESRAADAARSLTAAVTARLAFETAAYVAPTVTVEHERIWALVEEAAGAVERPLTTARQAASSVRN